MNDIVFFILGLLFAIPLGVTANLYTPKFQRWIAVKSNKRAEKQRKNIEKAYLQIKEFHTDRTKLREYLLGVIIKTTLIGAIIGILAGILYAVPQILTVTVPEQYLTETIKVTGPEEKTEVYNEDTDELVESVTQTETLTSIPKRSVYQYLIPITSSLAQVLAIIGAIFILNISMGGIRTLNQVNNFKEYEVSILKIIK